MFKLFWPFNPESGDIKSPSLSDSKKKASSPFSIPEYKSGVDEDSIDLQIKSLTYMFKRYRIHLLSHFLKNDQIGVYEFEWFPSPSLYEQSSLNFNDKHNDKLDMIYNKDAFESMILNDPYRILIDYTKNKFRSMLILSEEPIEMKNKIPDFPISNFKFLVLKANSSESKYIDILVNKSDIYIEHKIPNTVKIEILKNVLKVNTRNKPITKDDRSKIIQSYLQQLAFYIQVDRIYKATLKSKESFTSTTSTTASPKKVLNNSGTTVLNDISNGNIPQLRPKASKASLTVYDSNTKPKSFATTSPTTRSASPNGKLDSADSSYPKLRSSRSIATLRHQSPTPTPASTSMTTPLASPSRNSNANNTSINSSPNSHMPIRTLRDKPSMSILKMDKVYESASKPKLVANQKSELIIAEVSDEENQLQEEYDDYTEDSLSSADDDDDEYTHQTHKDTQKFVHSSNSPVGNNASLGKSLPSQVQIMSIQSLSNEEKSLYYEQSKSLVAIRIEREKQILSK